MKKESLSTQEKQTVALLAAQGLLNNAIAKKMSRHHATTRKELLTPESQIQVVDIQERLGRKYLELAEKVIDRVNG